MGWLQEQIERATERLEQLPPHYRMVWNERKPEPEYDGCRCGHPGLGCMCGNL
jgi:hypothetical protein